VWTADVCQEVAEEVVQFFGNGSDSTSVLKAEAKLGRWPLQVHLVNFVGMG